MSALELGLLGLTGVFTAMLTAMVGYGGGTILMVVVLQFMPPAAAIPFHGLVQLVSNGWRVWLFRAHVGWHLAWRFLVLLPPGILLGLWVFQGISTPVLNLLIGLFVVGTLFTRHLKRFRGSDLPLWAFFPLGLVMGILNMLIGVVMPLMGAVTIRSELNKEGLIATLAFFSMAGHLAKMVAFGSIGFDFGAYLLPAAVLIPTVMVGGVLGKRMLGVFNERLFQIFFRLLLAGLGLKLALWDGARHLL